MRGRVPLVPGDDARTTRRVRRVRLRALLVGGGTAWAVLAVALPPAALEAPAVAQEAPRSSFAVVELYQDGVGLAPDGSVAQVPAGTAGAYLEGTRVLDPRVAHLSAVLDGGQAAPGLTAARTLADEQRAWLAVGTVPGAGGPHEDMARTALLDLRTLLLPDGALVAGWSPRWRYVWPRDAAFGAVALARTGHLTDALEILDFLGRVQDADGGFEARYLPDGSGPPDDRRAQTDGQGWAMWAAGQVLAQVPAGPVRTSVALRLTPLVARAVEATLAQLGPDGLPPASPDYWEKDEHALTLGTVAPLVGGLEQAGVVLTAAGDVTRATTAAAAAADLRRVTVARFGPDYARYAADQPGGAGLDAAAAFVGAPFWAQPAPGAPEARVTAAAQMRRPVGLAPAGQWRDDGITWTPQTSLFAWVAAENGDDEAARAWLDAIDAHRTGSGSIPEKILADGRPAAVAPLAWSAANVLLALDALDR
ncbi:glycoside hydrolase 15-related protein [Cellulomonas gilvus ATCC 13127]|uniref:Glycoside hydrolase 15-related protein n=1 Tax=Cellulomonas gilvus (strain ATCC 13127 / NRRL B-14078) TaxID=593907 RepID=F8A5C9_CELGA|nr:glycoside hydrolase 15-related protein [Cellulomonas gilvus ATCC 13127]